MQKHTHAVLCRLLDECFIMRSPYVTVPLTMEERKIAFEILNELILEGYVCGFKPIMDAKLTCDLTSTALDHIDIDRQMVVYPPK